LTISSFDFIIFTSLVFIVVPIFEEVLDSFEIGEKGMSLDEIVVCEWDWDLEGRGKGSESEIFSEEWGEECCIPHVNISIKAIAIGCHCGYVGQGQKGF
jgi:hypothetical protein